MGLFFWLATEPIVGIFSDDPEVLTSATSYLAIVPLSLWGYGVVIITAGAFNAMGKSHYGLAQYLVRTAVLYIPLSFVAARMAGSDAVFYGIALANALAGIIVGSFALYWLANYTAPERSEA